MSMALGAALLALASVPAQADIITYTDGRTVKGIVEDRADSPTVSVITASSRLVIPRTRIREIKHESRSQGYVHIGTEHAARGNLGEAIKAYEAALKEDPANAEAQRLLDEAQGRLADQQRATRSDALSQIDKLALEAQDAIKAGDFKRAEAAYKEANRLVPSPEQAEKLRLAISDMYLKWAEEREDKLDNTGAEEKLNLALAANPNNEDVVQKMLRLWEDDPTKRAQTVNIYETILERHPEDRNMRRKLGDMYFEMNRWEDAATHFLQLYKTSAEYKGTELETKLVECLNRLHLQYAEKKEYDKAIYYFRLLAAIDPSIDPTGEVVYQYAKRERELPANDVKGRLELARFAQQNGMDQEALEQYRKLIKFPAAKAEAQKAIDAYAQRALLAAKAQFQQGNFTLAATLAGQIRTDYPEAQTIQEQAADLMGRASAEQAKDRRQRREFAKDLVRRGDEFYQQGWFHLNNLFSTERQNIPRLVSDRQMAKMYFQYAINAYQEAIQADPSLGTDSQSLVNVNLRQARAMLLRLNQRAPTLPENFGRPINTPQSSIPSYRR